MKVVLINGAPRSGKDTAAKALRDLPDFRQPRSFVWEKFSMPLKTAFAGMMYECIDNEGNVDYYEDHKDEVVEVLGCSYRQWQIDFSERFMKPRYGNNIFGRLLLDRLIHNASEGDLVVVSDCGFQIEADTILAHFNPEDVFLLSIYRKGKTYIGDSRSQLDVAQFPNSSVLINPEGKPEQFAEQVCDATLKFLERTTR